MRPKSPKLNALITRFREPYSNVSMRLEIKHRVVEFWQCTNTASGNEIFVFSVLSGSAEAQVI